MLSVGKSSRSDPSDPNTFDPYEQLDADYPDSVRAPSVQSGYNTSSTVSWIVALFIFRQLRIKQPKTTRVTKVSDARMAVRNQRQPISSLRMLVAIGSAAASA